MSWTACSSRKIPPLGRTSILPTANLTLLSLFQWITSKSIHCSSLLSVAHDWTPPSGTVSHCKLRSVRVETRPLLDTPGPFDQSEPSFQIEPSIEAECRALWLVESTGRCNLSCPRGFWPELSTTWYHPVYIEPLLPELQFLVGNVLLVLFLLLIWFCRRDTETIGTSIGGRERHVGRTLWLFILFSLPLRNVGTLGNYWDKYRRDTSLIIHTLPLNQNESQLAQVIFSCHYKTRS